MKNNQQLVLQSLSMDLLRAALGRHRGSHVMADRFIEESKKRLSELDESFNQSLLSKINLVLSTKSDRQAEDLLMYSTILRNRSSLYNNYGSR
ncbi:MAG: hypothetical protein WCG44_02040 [bacterium]